MKSYFTPPRTLLFRKVATLLPSSPGAGRVHRRMESSPSTRMLMSSSTSCVFSEVACSLCFMTGWKGFDHQLYSLLIEQAEFFLIDRLRDWILEKRYLQAVKLVRSVKLSESTRWIDVDSGVADRGLHKFDNREYTGDTKVEYFIYSTNRKFRACEDLLRPRWRTANIILHRDMQ